MIVFLKLRGNQIPILWRCEFQQIYKGMSLLLRPNKFFLLIRYFADASFDKKNAKLFLFIYLLLWLVFPNNPIGICPIRLKIGMFYHINNSF